MVFQNEHRPLELLHVGLRGQDGVVGHDLFEHLAHRAERVLLKAQTLQAFVVQHPQRQKNGGLALGQNAAVGVIRVYDIVNAVCVIVAQVPVEQAEIIAHRLGMDGQKGVIRVIESLPARPVQRAHDIGAAEQLIADRLELLELLVRGAA